jgi:glutamyl-tRNA(Gln) amidotransferase subunit E
MPIQPREIPAPSETPVEVYHQLGLRSGLEVHQQLLTAKKLFCRCPAGSYRNDFDAEIMRHMRPTLSEMGEYDGTALMEKRTRKEIIYQITGDTTCTYELDDSPPFMINAQAVDIAIEMAMLLGTNIVGEILIARKQYLDGSIPTGFQRTAIVGLNGSIPYRDREIRIRQLAIEEDACREISDIGHVRTWRTDRLSRPLCETVTDADMRTPGEVAEVCRIIARLARAAGKVRTGYGAGRQDVNVSVDGGTRVEIKGVPRIPLIPDLVHYEAFRQRALLDIRDRLSEMKRHEASFEPKVDICNGTLPLHEVASLARSLSEGGQVRLVTLPGFAEILPWPIGPNRWFVDELSDVVRVVACLDRMPNILFPGDGHATRDFWKWAKETSGAGDEDGTIVVYGPAQDAETAVEEITSRARAAFWGVPNQTRQMLRTGETRFERVLPGPDRMYPDTDLPPLAITEARLAMIEEALPVPVWKREAAVAGHAVPQNEAHLLPISPRYEVFDHAVAAGARPAEASRVLISTMIALRREGHPLSAVSNDALLELFEARAEDRFAPEAWRRLIIAVAAGSKPADAIREVVGEVPSAEEVETAVEYALGAGPEIEDRSALVRNRMGIAMTNLRGRVAGRRVRAELERALGEVKA